jgi:predicted metal-dependent phosphoesterase TrpH
MSIADLHLHTTASDGRLTPTQLMELVAGRGLKGVAVTDHDSTEGLAEAFEAAAAFPGLRVVPGIELSTDVPGNEIHVLAYYIQYTDTGVQERLARFREGRVDRARKMVEKLKELGVEIEWDRVQAIAGEGAVGRPHVALAMVEKGYIKEPREAFDAYIGRNGPAYVEREKLTPAQAVELIRDWGGAAVVAHPSGIPDLDGTLEELKKAGLAGIEVYYAQYSVERIKELAATAANHGLLACGGSDYHASGNTGEPLPGNMGPPLDTVDRLRELATRPVSIPA